MARATLFFNSLAEVPAALRSQGTVFETDNFSDFMYVYGNSFPGYKIVGDQLFYVKGTDAAGFATWTNCLIRIYEDGDGGDGGL